MKLNLGCGYNKISGFVNVDAWAGCEPDIVWNVEETPWRLSEESALAGSRGFLPGSCCDDIAFIHSLEHMGSTLDRYLAIWKEIYRVSRPFCRIHLRFPHHLSDSQWGDPTHLRAISVHQLHLLSRKLCAECKERGWPNTPLADMLGVDFEVDKVELIQHPRMQDRGFAPEELFAQSQIELNVCEEVRVDMHAVK